MITHLRSQQSASNSGVLDRLSPHSLMLVTVASCILILFAPSFQSLWMDEGWSVRVAMASGDLSGWWQMTTNDRCSTPSQLGHTLFVLLASPIFGVSEHGFRMANTLWGVCGILAFAYLGRKYSAPWFPLLFAVNPFVWFYIDEIRPYAMQLGVSAWMAVALLQILDQKTGSRERNIWINVFWLSCFICYAASMLGALSVAACFLAAIFAWALLRVLPQRNVWVFSALWAIPFALLSIYYLNLFLNWEGDFASKQWAPTPMNIAFAFYELFGFIAFGPGRDAIREAVKTGGGHGIWPLMKPYWLPLVAYGFLLGCGILGAILQLARGPRRIEIIVVTLTAGLNIAFMYAGSVLAGWPFWGRHLSPSLPFLLVAIGLGVFAFGRLSKVLIFALLAVSLSGSLYMRFAQTNQKDDYRTASRLARTAMDRGGSVWWAAEPLVPSYYNIFPEYYGNKERFSQYLPATPSKWPRAKNDEQNLCFLVLGLTPEEIRQAPAPELIILSKPDIWDRTGAVRSYIQEKQYQLVERLPAFTIWKPLPSVISRPPSAVQ